MLTHRLLKRIPNGNNDESMNLNVLLSLADQMARPKQKFCKTRSIWKKVSCQSGATEWVGQLLGASATQTRLFLLLAKRIDLQAQKLSMIAMIR